MCLGARLRAVVALACAQPAPACGHTSQGILCWVRDSALERVGTGAGACPGQILLAPSSGHLPRRWTVPSLANGMEPHLGTTQEMRAA